MKALKILALLHAEADGHTVAFRLSTVLPRI